MSDQLNVANLGMSFLNNSRNVNDLESSIIDIKNNINNASKNLELILKNLNLDNEDIVSNLKIEVSELSNQFHNVLGYNFANY